MLVDREVERGAKKTRGDRCLEASVLGSGESTLGL